MVSTQTLCMPSQHTAVAAGTHPIQGQNAQASRHEKPFSVSTQLHNVKQEPFPEDCEAERSHQLAVST